VVVLIVVMIVVVVVAGVVVVVVVALVVGVVVVIVVVGERVVGIGVVTGATDGCINIIWGEGAVTPWGTVKGFRD
jgi:hypothetical protein